MKLNKNQQQWGENLAEKKIFQCWHNPSSCLQREVTPQPAGLWHCVTPGFSCGSEISTSEELVLSSLLDIPAAVPELFVPCGAKPAVPWGVRLVCSTLVSCWFCTQPGDSEASLRARWVCRVQLMGHLEEMDAEELGCQTFLCSNVPVHRGSSSFPQKSPEVKAARGFIGWSQRCDLHPETTAVTKLQEQIPKSAEPDAEAAEWGEHAEPTEIITFASSEKELKQTHTTHWRSMTRMSGSPSHWLMHNSHFLSVLKGTESLWSIRSDAVQVQK